MTGFKLSVVVFFLNFLWTFSRGDVEHSCDVGDRCILPCTFDIGDEVVIHWILLKSEGIQAHSYYHSKDQFGLQDKRFSNRTSLFEDQITKGNASLQLTDVKVQDEGRYKCYTSTIRKNKESFINLKVDAAVHKVNIQKEGNRITCSSEGIYPEPELTWSTTPSNINHQNKSTVQQNEQQLYSITSSLVLSDSGTDLVCICTVTTRKNKRTATLSQTTSSGGSSSETTLTCSTSNSPLTGFIWKFNHSQTIVTWMDGSSTVSEEWKQQVKDVSKSGDITLQDLSSDQEGIYTCNAGDTSSIILYITEDNPINVAGIVVGVLAGLVVLAVLIVLYIYLKRQKFGRVLVPSQA